MLNSVGLVDGEKWEIEADLFGLNLENQRDLLRGWNGGIIYISEFGETPQYAIDTGRLRNEYGVIIAEGNPPRFGHWCERYARPPTEAEYDRHAETGFILSDGETVAGVDGSQRPLCEMFVGESGESRIAAAALKRFGLPADFYREMRKQPDEFYRRFALGRRGIYVSGRPVYRSFSGVAHCRDHIPIIPAATKPIANCISVRTPTRTAASSPRKRRTGKSEWYANGTLTGRRRPRLAQASARTCLNTSAGIVSQGFTAIRRASLMCRGADAAFLHLFNAGLREAGVARAQCVPAPTNNWHFRVDAVERRFRATIGKGLPALVIDRTKCPRLANACGLYRFKETAGGTFSQSPDKPHKDENSGPAEALQYLCLALGAGQVIRGGAATSGAFRLDY